MTLLNEDLLIARQLVTQWVYDIPWVKRAWTTIPFTYNASNAVCFMTKGFHGETLTKEIELDQSYKFSVTINTFSAKNIMYELENYLHTSVYELKDTITEYMIYKVLLNLPYTQTRFSANLTGLLSIEDQRQILVKTIERCMKQSISDHWEGDNFVLSSPKIQHLYLLHAEDNWLTSQIAKKIDTIWDLIPTENYLCVGNNKQGWIWAMTEPSITVTNGYDSASPYVTITGYFRFGAAIKESSKVLLVPIYW